MAAYDTDRQVEVREWEYREPSRPYIMRGVSRYAPIDDVVEEAAFHRWVRVELDVEDAEDGRGYVEGARSHLWSKYRDREILVSQSTHPAKNRADSTLPSTSRDRSNAS